MEEQQVLDVRLDVSGLGDEFFHSRFTAQIHRDAADGEASLPAGQRALQLQQLLLRPGSEHQHRARGHTSGHRQSQSPAKAPGRPGDDDQRFAEPRSHAHLNRLTRRAEEPKNLKDEQEHPRESISHASGRHARPRPLSGLLTL